MPKKMKSSPKSSSTYDVIVIGAGSAGIAALEGAKAAGAKKIGLVEASTVLGGECPWWACVPTKAMLKASKLYHLVKYNLGKYGVKAEKVSFDFGTIVKRRQAVIKSLTGSGQSLSIFAKKLGVTVKHGEAKFLNVDTVDVRGERIRSRAFVIATGSRERDPVIDGFEQAPVWHSRDVVSMKTLPSSAVIVGGGPVGSEFATFFGQLGVKTTLLEFGDHILPREDAEIAVLAEAHLRKLGVNVLTKSRPLGLKQSSRQTQITFQVGRKPRQSLMVDHVIIATGRRANLDSLELANAGVKIDDRGRLILSSSLQTNAEHIFAAGDVTSSYQFTHTASYEGYIAGWNAARVQVDETRMQRDTRVVPRITFVDPEVASVGMTMLEATKLKKKIKIYRCPLSILGRAAIDGNRDGLLKVIVDVKNDQILGAHLIGERAGEVIHELALAMYANVPFAVVRGMIHAYPSWSEAIPAAE